MAQFEAKKLNIDNINNAQEFVDGDGLNAQVINEMVEGIMYAETSGGGSGGGSGVTLTNSYGESEVNGYTQKAVNGVAQAKNYYNESFYDSSVSNGDSTANVPRKTGLHLITLDDVPGSWYWQTVTDPDMRGCFLVFHTPSNNWVINFRRVVEGWGVSFDCFSETSGVVGEIRIYANASNYSTPKDFIRAHPNLYIEYELPPEYQYEDRVIENQPIRFLPLDGELELYNEWRKGLNLWTGSYASGAALSYDGGNTFAADGYNTSSKITVKPNTTYTASNVSVICGYGANDNYVQKINFGNYVDGVVTFTTNSQVAYIRMTSKGTSFMLNEGFHPYPYVPYSGKIIHQTDLDPVFEKIDKLSQDTEGSISDIYDVIDEVKEQSFYSHQINATLEDGNTEFQVVIPFLPFCDKVENAKVFAEVLYNVGYTTNSPKQEISLTRVSSGQGASGSAIKVFEIASDYTNVYTRTSVLSFTATGTPTLSAPTFTIVTFGSLIDTVEPTFKMFPPPLYTYNSNPNSGTNVADVESDTINIKITGKSLKFGDNSSTNTKFKFSIEQNPNNISLANGDVLEIPNGDSRFVITITDVNKIGTDDYCGEGYTTTEGNSTGTNPTPWVVGDTYWVKKKQ